MITQNQRHILTGMLWVLAVTLMVVHTIVRGERYLGDWALLVGLGACVFSGWSLLVNERHRDMRIASVVARRIAERNDVHRIH